VQPIYVTGCNTRLKSYTTLNIDSEISPIPPLIFTGVKSLKFGLAFIPAYDAYDGPMFSPNLM